MRSLLLIVSLACFVTAFVLAVSAFVDRDTFRRKPKRTWACGGIDLDNAGVGHACGCELTARRVHRVADVEAHGDLGGFSAALGFYCPDHCPGGCSKGCPEADDPGRDVYGLSFGRMIGD